MLRGPTEGYVVACRKGDKSRRKDESDYLEMERKIEVQKIFKETPEYLLLLI